MKKIKYLTKEDIWYICKSFGDYCSDKCPLYRTRHNARLLCDLLRRPPKNYDKETLEVLEREVNIDSYMEDNQ